MIGRYAIRIQNMVIKVFGYTDQSAADHCAERGIFLFQPLPFQCASPFEISWKGIFERKSTYLRKKGVV